MISQNQRQLIIEEIADLYLAYMYDTNIRIKLIQQLTISQFNLLFNSTLDADAIADYCTKNNREHGLSKERCFFGRVSLLRSQQSQKIESSTFVYTSATIRLLEQISASISMRETVLLVGETGTGKTTAV